MATPAHPHAMAPRKPGSTRTAPPMRPSQFPLQGRYRAYTIFGATGIVYLLLGLVALRVVWALGDGAAAWSTAQAQLASPLYLGFHLLSLVAVVFVGIRFFRLFPKAQPARIGPVKPPPPQVLHAGLYLAWLAVAGGFAFVLAGGIF